MKFLTLSVVMATLIISGTARADGVNAQSATGTGIALMVGRFALSAAGAGGPIPGVLSIAGTASTVVGMHQNVQDAKLKSDKVILDSLNDDNN